MRRTRETSASKELRDFAADAEAPEPVPAGCGAAEAAETALGPEQCPTAGNEWSRLVCKAENEGPEVGTQRRVRRGEEL